MKTGKYLLSIALIVIGSFVSFSKFVQAAGNDVTVKSDNLLVCTGANCVQSNPAGTGNVILENKLGIGKVPAQPIDVVGQIQASGNITTGSCMIWPQSNYLCGVNAADIKFQSGYSQASSIAVMSHPIAYYRFDENTGTAISNNTPTSLSATAVNTSWVAGKYNSALSFNGSSSRVVSTANATLDAITSNFTITAWVYRTANANMQVVSKVNVAGSGGYALLIGASGEVYCRTYNGGSLIDSYTAVGQVPLSTWTHLAVSRTGASCRVYVNGVDRTNVAGSHVLTASTYPLTIGARADLTGEFFSGYIDEVKVYNVYFTPAQAAGDYNWNDLTNVGFLYSNNTDPGTGFLTPSAGWGLRVNNGPTVFPGGYVTVPNVNSPGINVGDNIYGGIKIGSTGWYDDGTYFRLFEVNRPFYIRNSAYYSLFYSPTMYLGDGGSANNIYFRGTKINANNWSLSGSNGAFNTTGCCMYISAGANPAYYDIQSVNTYWQADVGFFDKSDGSSWVIGYYNDDNLHLQYGATGSGPWQTPWQVVWNSNNYITNNANLMFYSSSYGTYTKYTTNQDNWLRLVRADGTYATYHDLAVGSFYAGGAVRFDLAEITPVDPSENLILGEIVTTDPGHSVRLHRSQSPYQTDTVGIVSNGRTASMVIGGDTGPEVADSTPDRKPIALAGRVVTFVNTENGPIKTGDVITTSSAAGVGMKAKEAGVVVSKAMEDFDGKTVNSEGVTKILEKLKAELKKEDPKYPQYKQIENAISQLEKPLPKNTGRIITFVNVHSYDPDIKLVNLDDYKLDGEKLTKDGSTINRLGAYARLITGKLTTSLVETKKLVVDGVDLASRSNDLDNRLNNLENEVNNKLKK